MCVHVRARARSPTILRAAQWKLRGATSPGRGAFWTRAASPFAAALLARALVC